MPDTPNPGKKRRRSHEPPPAVPDDLLRRIDAMFAAPPRGSETQPPSVVGTFRAEAEDLDLAGAFSAER